jgi:hypothetical protein
MLLSGAETSSTESTAEYVYLLGNSTFPEGIMDLPDGRFMVGGFGDGSLQLVNLAATPPVTYFSAPGENGMVIAVGFVYDESRDWLWVANFNFDTGDSMPGSNLKIFSLSTGTVVATLPSEEFVPGAFYNELTLAVDGTVYITDTFNPSIYRGSPDNLTAVELLVTDPLLRNPAEGQPIRLNGLALSPDGKYLIASVMDRLDAGDGRLVRISVADKTVTNVTLMASSIDTPAAVDACAGSDGMFFMSPSDVPDGSDRTLLMVNVYSPAGAIISGNFSDDYSTATLTIRDHPMEVAAFGIQQSRAGANISVYNRPTASAILDGMLWTVNSQLDHIIDDANGAINTPHDVPFQIVGVPLSTLFVFKDMSEETSESENTKSNDECDSDSAYVVATMASSFVVAAAFFSIVMAV